MAPGKPLTHEERCHLARISGWLEMIAQKVRGLDRTLAADMMGEAEWIFGVVNRTKPEENDHLMACLKADPSRQELEHWRKRALSAEKEIERLEAYCRAMHDPASRFGP